MQKTYILDTNILLQTAGAALNGFDDNEVVITHTTLEELDVKKTSPGELGYNARNTIRIISRIMDQNSRTDHNGIFRIETDRISPQALPQGWDVSRADNRIISAALLTAQEQSAPVILVTNDVSMQIKARICGVQVQDYRNDQVDTDKLYTGRQEFVCKKEFVDRLYAEKEISANEFFDDYQVEPKSMIENQYLAFFSSENEAHSALAQYQDNMIKLLPDIKGQICGVYPKNMGQKFAMNALLAPADKIPLVILKGAAGVGKTLLAIAAGINGTYDDSKNQEYQKIIITRSNTLADEDLGFLPGDVQEKMTPLLAPFFDNLEYIFGSNKEENRETAQTQIDYLIDNGIVEICSLAYIRGRSISQAYIIVDETQNITVTQAKTIVTRAGLGTKVVFLGDPDQIDNPKVDKKNNGLVWLSEKMKGSPLCAQVEFKKDSESVRSPLAIEAISRL